MLVALNVVPGNLQLTRNAPWDPNGVYTRRLLWDLDVLVKVPRMAKRMILACEYDSLHREFACLKIKKLALSNVTLLDHDFEQNGLHKSQSCTQSGILDLPFTLP